MLLIRGRELNGRAKSQNEESMNELKRERESVCERERERDRLGGVPVCERGEGL